MKCCQRKKRYIDLIFFIYDDCLIIKYFVAETGTYWPNERRRGRTSTEGC